MGIRVGPHHRGGRGVSVGMRVEVLDLRLGLDTSKELKDPMVGQSKQTPLSFTPGSDPVLQELFDSRREGNPALLRSFARYYDQLIVQIDIFDRKVGRFFAADTGIEHVADGRPVTLAHRALIGHLGRLPHALQFLLGQNRKTAFAAALVA